MVSRGGGGGIGCRETTIAPVLPTVTQRTFEMNYFIANCAVPYLCGLQLDKDSPTLQTRLRAKTEIETSTLNTHLMSAVHVEMVYLQLNTQYSLLTSQSDV